MTTQTEKLLYKKIAAVLKAKYPDIFYMRVENQCQAGTPDLFLCVDGFAIWIEMKARKGSLRTTQIRWHEKYVAAGGKALVLHWDSEDQFRIENLHNPAASNTVNTKRIDKLVSALIASACIPKVLGSPWV